MFEYSCAMYLEVFRVGLFMNVSLMCVCFRVFLSVFVYVHFINPNSIHTKCRTVCVALSSIILKIYALLSELLVLRS